MGAQHVQQMLQIPSQRPHHLHGAGALGGRLRHRPQHAHEREQQLPVQPPQLPSEICRAHMFR